MNKLQVFNYDNNEVRTVLIDGAPWWAAKDVCDVFGETNRNRAMQALDDDEKGYTQIDTPGGKQQLSIVNEAGLYALLFAMQPSKARGVDDEYVAAREESLRKFKRWVTHEVLPSIRRHGLYAVDELLADPDLFIQALEALKAERAKSTALLEEKETLEIALNESLKFYTVAKYNKAFRKGWSLSKCKDIGKRLSAYCRARAIEVRRCETNDERFGIVNSYPLTAWEDFLHA